jgi:predicted nucleic acid-binding protein
MKKLVLDTCVFLKIFLLEEEDSKTAVSLLSTVIDKRIDILVPRLFYYEVFGIARKKGVPLKNVWDVLQDYQATLLQYVPEDKHITEQTLKICEKGTSQSGYPAFYDASYHAIALVNCCDFITVDKKYYEKAKSLGHIKLLSDVDI